MTKAEIRLAQQELNRLGIRGADGLPLLEDGIIGPQTLHAMAQAKARAPQPTQGVPLPRPKPGDLNARPGMAIPRDHPNRPSLRRDIDEFARQTAAITPNRQMGAMQIPAQPSPPMPAMRDPDSRMSIHDPGHRYSESMNLRDAARSPQSPRGIEMAAARQAEADRWRQGKWASQYGSRTSPQLAGMGAAPFMGDRFAAASPDAGPPSLELARRAARARLIPLMPPATSDWDRPVDNAMVAERPPPMPNGFAELLSGLDPIRRLIGVPTTGGAPVQAAPIPQRQERPNRGSLAEQQAAAAEQTRRIREERLRRQAEHQARMQQLRAGR